jgi:hypothetical protein
MYIPWSRVLMDMPVVTLKVKKFPNFCGTERFISIFTRPSLSHQYLITIFKLFKVSTLRRICMYVFCLLTLSSPVMPPGLERVKGYTMKWPWDMCRHSHTEFIHGLQRGYILRLLMIYFNHRNILMHVLLQCASGRALFCLLDRWMFVLSHKKHWRFCCWSRKELLFRYAGSLCVWWEEWPHCWCAQSTSKS